jgi:hypothetical protein
MKAILTGLAIGAAALPVVAPADEAMITIDATSERVLTEACSYLRSATRFSVDADIEYEDILLDGTTVTYHRQYDMAVERPDRLRVDVVDDKGARSVIVNADEIVVYRPDSNVYATRQVDGSLDARIAKAEGLGLVFPLSDLVQSRPCSDLVETMHSATYAGRHFLDGRFAHHLLVKTDLADVQLWIDDDMTPEIVRLVIRYRELPGQPRFSARLDDWDIETGQVDPFSFTPPPGSTRVEFRSPEVADGGQ